MLATMAIQPPHVPSIPPTLDDEVVQPSREWVLPARGKPGRKPADAVPMTKRKAQNRASQRAFRERRHAYVSELEEKVAQYKEREIEANVQMQRIALQCREEALALRRENEELTRRVGQLEAQLVACKARTSEGASKAAAAQQPHAAAATQPPAPPAPHAAPSRPPAAPQPPSPQPPTPHAPTPHAPTPQPPTPLSPDDEIDCGFCTSADNCACRGRLSLGFDEAPLEPPRGAVPLRRAAPRTRARLWSTSAPQMPLRRQAHARPKLWATTAPAERVQCTGSPLTCRACGGDPDLQRFCSAIARHAGRHELGSESIPAAFTRIRSHPNYAHFRGGLDLLADVVLRGPQGEKRAAPAAPAPAARDDEHAPKQARSEPLAVGAALALLDRTDGGADAQRPCPCPWYNAPSRLPWPR